MSKSLFENSQWAVTHWGLEFVKPGAPYAYNIAADTCWKQGLRAVANFTIGRSRWPKKRGSTWARLARLFGER
jgi:hypothetical protein